MRNQISDISRDKINDAHKWADYKNTARITGLYGAGVACRFIGVIVVMP